MKGKSSPTKISIVFFVVGVLLLHYPCVATDLVPALLAIGLRNNAPVCDQIAFRRIFLVIRLRMSSPAINPSLYRFSWLTITKLNSHCGEDINVTQYKRIVLLLGAVNRSLEHV